MFVAQRIAVIIVGLLIVATRLVGVVDPPRFKRYVRGMLAKGKPMQAIGIFSFTASISFFGYLWETSTATGVILAIISFALLFATSFAFVPQRSLDWFGRNVIDGILGSDAVCRVVCSLAVLLGLVVIVVAGLGI